MNDRATVLAICNQKGGVGKTVTTVNLGIGLARAGKRVLLVDVDSQGSLTASLGYQHPDQMEDTLAAVLEDIILDKPLTPGRGILHHEEGVDLLPANIELSGLEVTLVNTMSRETILREYLNSVREQYDVILLDCCPSLGMLTINALAAADKVIVPLQAHYLSIKGMEQLIRTISNVKRKINPIWRLRASSSRWRTCGPTTPGRSLSCCTAPMTRNFGYLRASSRSPSVRRRPVRRAGASISMTLPVKFPPRMPR